jgi:TrmH family RNA methyltransferase
MSLEQLGGRFDHGYGARAARVVAAAKLRRRRYRDAEGLFLAEGPQAVREAVASPGVVVELFLTPQALQRYGEIAASAADGGARISVVTEAGLATLGETVTPQGLVAVCRHIHLADPGPARDPASGLAPGLASGSASGPASGSAPGVASGSAPGLAPGLASGSARNYQIVAPTGGAQGATISESRDWAPRLAVVLAGIGDPGNAGTVLRTADAAGADTVVFADGTVDPYNGKVVRASAGSLFHVRLVRGGDPVRAVERLRAGGSLALVADGYGDTELDALLESGRLSGGTTWIFGSEAHGTDPAVAAAADLRVRIPMYGRAESLNLAAAAAVCLFASARSQRRKPASLD